jgi:hypothetical protein
MYEMLNISVPFSTGPKCLCSKNNENCCNLCNPKLQPKKRTEDNKQYLTAGTALLMGLKKSGTSSKNPTKSA